MARTHGCVIDSDYQAISNNATPEFPWPPRANTSVLDALAATWKESVFQPASFFRRMPHEFDFGWVLGYYLVLGVIAAGISLFWHMVLGPSVLERLVVRGTEDAGNPLLDFLLSPLLLLVALYIAAGVIHLFLLMFRGNRYGFSTTLRVLCFASGPQLFEIVPVIGSVVGGIWGLVLTVIGLREAHETSTGKAVAALVVPTVLFLLLVSLLIFASFVLGLNQLRS